MAVIIYLLLFAGGYVFSTRGTNDPTSYLIYFASSFWYFLVVRLRPRYSALAGAGAGALYAQYEYEWITKFAKMDPYYATIVLNGVGFALTFALASYLIRKYPQSDFIRIFSLSFGILALRTIIHYSPVLPYAKAFLMLANTPTLFDWLIPYFGSSAVDVLVIATGCAVARGLEFTKNKRVTPSFVGIITLLIFLTTGSVIVRNFLPIDDAARPSVKVALVQGNFNWPWDVRVKNTGQMFEYFLGQSKIAAQKGAKIIIWPEYAIPKDILHHEMMMGERLANASHDLDAVIVLGSLEIVPGPPRPDGKWNGYDLSLVFDPEHILLEPYRAIFPFTDNVLSGTKPVIFDSTYARFPVISCFEVANHKFVRDYTQNGKPIDFYIGIANIQLFDGTSGHDRIRNHIRRIVAENGKYFVYVANTGPSTVFDRSGNALAATHSGERATLIFNVPKIPENTMYSTYQELPAALAVFGPLLFIVYSHRAKTPPTKRSKTRA